MFENFPDSAVLPAIDLQSDSTSAHFPSSLPASVPVIDLPDDTGDHFEQMDELHLTAEQEEALYNEGTMWYAMNNPAGKLGIEVNEFGEVRSTNPEVHLIQGGTERMKISKYNKALGGKPYTVYVYRAGKQKIYDFELGMEVFKTFNPQYSAYQIRLRYENRDRTDCSLVNLSVDSFILPNAKKGKSVTSEIVVLKDGDYWMAMVGNGNNVIGNYKVSASGIPAY